MYIFKTFVTVKVTTKTKSIVYDACLACLSFMSLTISIYSTLYMPHSPMGCIHTLNMTQ